MSPIRAGAKRMTDKSHKNDQNNIILYPGLVRRLLELGMDALKAKDGKRAHEYFEQAESIEPENAKVRFGKMLSLVELGKLEEAVNLTDKLLREDSGDYFENLQVHISLLVQLSRYEEVIELLDAVLAENRFPHQHAESLYKLLHFSRQMTESLPSVEQSLVEEELDDEVEQEELDKLQSSNPELEWQAIQNLGKKKQRQATEAFITYIEDSTNDWLLQSYALQFLMDWNVVEEITITKLGQTQVVVPDTLKNEGKLTHFISKMKQLLVESLEHEDPILMEMSTQLMVLHSLTLFPFLPEESEQRSYAAAFTIIACERIASDYNEIEIVETFKTNRSDVLKKIEFIEELEGQVFRHGLPHFHETDR
ncbi:tetratricopeptide repeat protein [Alkalicoccobacillus gibsonii]|uniref:tetratricopeptide repeat protein n=1 Tax=Alkalicoccobacillus gibsonii TaxID=79881 RepID=UPI001AEECBA6|nr:tetratricopeptide repeat protein [Alkalicoccobacillus gibsonii]